MRIVPPGRPGGGTGRGGRPATATVKAVAAMALILCLASCAPRARVLYTASLNGNLVGCDCWGYPEAGLDKRAYYLAGESVEDGGILLDAGNVLAEGRSPFLADLILQTYRELGYAAAAVGVNELAEGADLLALRASGNPGPPLLSHNLVLDGRRLTTDPLILPVGSDGPAAVAVIALADPEWFGPHLSRLDGRLTVADPAAALTESLRRAEAAGASAVILLAHGREDWIRSLMAASTEARKPGPPVAAVLLAGQERLIEERLPGGIPLLSPGEAGNRLGILEIRLANRPRWKNEFVEFHYLGPSDPQVAARGNEYQDWLDARRNER